jgi:hypothetical protein
MMGIGTPRSQSNIAGIFALRIFSNLIEKFGDADLCFKGKKMSWNGCHGRVMGVVS